MHDNTDIAVLHTAQGLLEVGHSNPSDACQSVKCYTSDDSITAYPSFRNSIGGRHGMKDRRFVRSGACGKDDWCGMVVVVELLYESSPEPDQLGTLTTCHGEVNANSFFTRNLCSVLFILHHLCSFLFITHHDVESIAGSCSLRRCFWHWRRCEAP